MESTVAMSRPSSPSSSSTCSDDSVCSYSYRTLGVVKKKFTNPPKRGVSVNKTPFVVEKVEKELKYHLIDESLRHS